MLNTGQSFCFSEWFCFNTIVYTMVVIISSSLCRNYRYWDGTAWTEVADIATVKRRCYKRWFRFNTSVAMMAGGWSPGDSPSSATEEWTVPELCCNKHFHNFLTLDLFF
jgi:hypothetical protein